jgi:small redox-active disulfide protein 2
MKRIEVLGPGCPKCERLAAAARDAADALGIEYELDKVTEIKAITARGVMMTPALVVDGQVKVVGRVPAADELAKMIG